MLLAFALFQWNSTRVYLYKSAFAEACCDVDDDDKYVCVLVFVIEMSNHTQRGFGLMGDDYAPCCRLALVRVFAQLGEHSTIKTLPLGRRRANRECARCVTGARKRAAIIICDTKLSNRMSSTRKRVTAVRGCLGLNSTPEFVVLWCIFRVDLTACDWLSEFGNGVILAGNRGIWTRAHSGSECVFVMQVWWCAQTLQTSSKFGGVNVAMLSAQQKVTSVIPKLYARIWYYVDRRFNKICPRNSKELWCQTKSCLTNLPDVWLVALTLKSSTLKIYISQPLLMWTSAYVKMCDFRFSIACCLCRLDTHKSSYGQTFPSSNSRFMVSAENLRSSSAFGSQETPTRSCSFRQIATRQCPLEVAYVSPTMLFALPSICIGAFVEHQTGKNHPTPQHTSHSRPA